MRGTRVAAALLGIAAVAIAALALMRDAGSSESAGSGDGPPGFEDITPGRKPLIFDIGPLVFDAELRSSALAEARGLGSDAIRVVVPWNMVAPEQKTADFRPSDPTDDHYDFLTYDPLLRQIKQGDMKIVLTPSGPAPDWATRSGGGGEPDPAQFGDFVSALAKRYSGRYNPTNGTFVDPSKADSKGLLPKVDLWSIWNEPNLSIFLQPQHKNGRAYSPLLYRQLFFAADDAINAEDPQAPVLIGETAPTGSTDSVDPIAFVRQTLCLDPSFHHLPGCPEADRKVTAAGWAAHPYSLSGQAPFEPVPKLGYVTMASLGTLERTLESAAARGAVAAGLPIYITEFGVQSFPDPNAGVSVEQQAEYIAIAERIAYADGRVATFGQYLMRDDDPNVVPDTLYGGFESGLRFFDGRPKPAYAAFQLPLAIQRLGETVSMWGIVQPYKGPTAVSIRYQDPDGAPKLLRTVPTDSAGIYSFTSAYEPGREWQVVWRAPTDGKTYHSPWYRSYQFAQPPSVENPSF